MRLRYCHAASSRTDADARGTMDAWRSLLVAGAATALGEVDGRAVTGSRKVSGTRDPPGREPWRARPASGRIGAVFRRVRGGAGMSTGPYYFARNGVRYGPVSGEQLRALAATGKLAPQDHVWQQGMAEWAA